MDLVQLKECADEKRKALNTTVEIVSDLESEFPGKEKYELTSSGKLLLQRYDYPSLLDLLRTLAEVGQHAKYSMQWSCLDQVLFSWDSPAVTVWLNVTPDAIPQELLGPECRLVKSEKVDVRYDLVCER